MSLGQVNSPLLECAHFILFKQFMGWHLIRVKQAYKSCKANKLVIDA